MRWVRPIWVLGLVCCDMQAPLRPTPSPSASAPPTVVSSTPSAESASSSASVVDVVPVGAPHPVTSITRVLTTERDSVVVVFSHAPKGEAATSGMLILDAKSDRIAFRSAWDAAMLTPTQIVYGAPRDVERAKRLRITLSDADVFGSGEQARFVQPVVFDLESGRERALAVAGGGVLVRVSDRIVGFRRPWPWRQPKDAPEGLSVDRQTWLPISEALAREVAAVTEEPKMTVPAGFEVTTRDRRLRIALVGDSGLQAARVTKR